LEGRLDSKKYKGTRKDNEGVALTEGKDNKYMGGGEWLVWDS